MLEIRRIDAWHCPLPLIHPVRLGAMTYNTRDYVVLRIETTDGHVGRALGYTRGTPLLAALKSMASAISPALGLDPGAVQTDLKRRFMPGWASFVRAASLIDIALWDIAAQDAQMPMRDLLGLSTLEPGCMVVAGYFADVRTRAEILDEVSMMVVGGATTVKVMVSGIDLAADVALVAEVGRILPAGVDLAIDLHGSLVPFSGNAAEACRIYGDLGVAFIEDPFPGTDWRPMARLFSETGLRFAVGEDLVGLSGVLDLLPFAHLFRVDATASGGYTFALAALEAAEAAGVAVAPHVFAPIHAPLSGPSSRIRLIENIPAAVGADPFYALLEPSDRTTGVAWPTRSEAFGLDLPFNWTRVEASASGRWAFTQTV